MGGRANRVGVNALYLALDPQTAIGEYKHVSTLELDQGNGTKGFLSILAEAFLPGYGARASHELLGGLARQQDGGVRCRNVGVLRGLG
jgi:hypothetical protein